MKFPRVGNIVKFIGEDGKSTFTKIISFKTEEDSTLHAILEIQSGEKKGFVGKVPERKIQWNGKFFEADMRILCNTGRET